MSDLFETLKGIVGDEEVASKVQSALGEFMIPKTEYAKVRDLVKTKDSELEQLRVANMNESEKLQHELAKAQALQKDFSIKTNRLEAEKLFVSAGLSLDDYGSILDNSVSDDKDKTLSIVNGIVNVLAKEKESVANRTKEELINKTKKPEQGTNPNGTPPKAIKRTF